MKKLKCCGCKDRYPADTIVKFPAGNFCSVNCASEYATAKSRKQREQAAKRKEKQEKKAHTKRKKELKDNDRTFQAKQAQAEFNKFIRLRDYGNDCISCQKPPLKKNAGHYKTTKAHPELRFCEAQVHLQCEHCNTHLSGNIYNYRPNLINKVGIEMVEWIEGPHKLKKYTAANFLTIRKWYKRKNKRLMEKDNV